MEFGIALLSVIPCRAEASDKSEQTTQLLFGETYRVLEKGRKWILIKIDHDNYEAWISANQHNEISSEEYKRIRSSVHGYSSELVGLLEHGDVSGKRKLLPILPGSSLPGIAEGSFSLSGVQYQFEGQCTMAPESAIAKDILSSAYLFLSAPYSWGGRSLFGIDCSGFVQVVYKIHGIKLPRDASQQAGTGSTLNFIEEASPGDIAFFDNEEGQIIHVGILLGNSHIIHASGSVHVDKIDHQGIFNIEKQSYTHRLRLIKRVL